MIERAIDYVKIRCSNIGKHCNEQKNHFNGRENFLTLFFLLLFGYQILLNVTQIIRNIDYEYNFINNILI